MKAKDLGWKDVALVAVALMLNAAVLTQWVDGTFIDPVSTAFAQPYGDGLPCTDPSECTSGFCADGVCCNTACTEAGQDCGLPGRVGVCVSSAESPVMAVPFQWVAAGLVALIAALRIRRRLS